MPFTPVPAVLAWHSLFEQPQWRYPFLVLDGPSQTGKSIFARSQSPGQKCLFVDCSGASVPDLSGYDASRHELIVYDEASAELVLRHKKLFQSAPEVVVIGGSSTNCYARRVVVYRKKMIVCSNRWDQEVRKLISEDRAWLQQNSVYVGVASPLWVGAAAPPVAGSSVELPTL
jgi:uncharacterized membrane-anchored protein